MHVFLRLPDGGSSLAAPAIKKEKKYIFQLCLFSFFSFPCLSTENVWRDADDARQKFHLIYFDEKMKTREVGGK